MDWDDFRDISEVGLNNLPMIRAEDAPRVGGYAIVHTNYREWLLWPGKYGWYRVEFG